MKIKWQKPVLDDLGCARQTTWGVVNPAGFRAHPPYCQGGSGGDRPSDEILTQP